MAVTGKERYRTVLYGGARRTRPYGNINRKARLLKKNDCSDTIAATKIIRPSSSYNEKMSDASELMPTNQIIIRRENTRV